MPKFEYLRTYSMGEEKLNELGQQGWELVAIDGIGGWYIFKRKLEPTPISTGIRLHIDGEVWEGHQHTDIAPDGTHTLRMVKGRKLS